MNQGMIKVSVLYPAEEGKKFDMDYYCNTHIPLVSKLVGDAIKGSSVEKGVAGGAPGAPATYAAMGNLYFDSVDSFQASFGPHSAEIMGDVPNFTNIEPIMQISEVMI